VDKEFYASAYHGWLVEEFTRREIFGTDSVTGLLLRKVGDGRP
jgi:hypothetical protein